MSGLSRDLAQTHEALYPRLDMLTRQVEAIAARKPESDVPAETRAAAEALLFDMQRFRARASNPKPLTLSVSKGLPPAPDTHGALATILGQALAALDAFETRHSVWSEEHRGFVWLLARGELLPVARLRPHSVRPPVAGEDRRAGQIRADLLRRIAAKYDEGFDAGLRAATALAPAPLLR